MELIGSGRTADVYELDGGRVLRRYRDGWPAEPEAVVMIHLAEQGFPVPVIYDFDGSDLVMERIVGPTMVEAMVSGGLGLDEAQKLLADLHGRLHDVVPRVAADPIDRILHLDLHPENVLMVTDRGPVVIDWSTTTEGPPDYDVAVTALIYAEVSLAQDHPAARFAGQALTAFLRYAGVPSALMVERALELRRANPTLSDAEKSRLERAAALIR